MPRRLPRSAPLRASLLAFAALALALLGCLAPLRLPSGGWAFLQSAEWAESPRLLSSEDALPLIADATFELDVRGGSERKAVLAGLAGRGSYIADFGLLDVPVVGEVRARAGLRYSGLFPRGALELGIRKELWQDKLKGYELSIGAQTAGDDRRLDFLSDFGVLKYFKDAKAFYRFLWGFGWPFEGRSGGPGWQEMGSALGVTQQKLPPFGRGALTVGWRTGLFDSGLEGVLHPNSERQKERERGAKKKQSPVRQLLDSTPYACYGVDLPIGAVPGGSAKISCSLLPEHRVIEHALRLKLPTGSSGGAAALSVVLEQSMVDLRRARVRVGASYARA